MQTLTREREEKTVRKRRISKIAPHYNCKNLRFLIEFFDALNETPHSYAQRTENPIATATALRLQLNKDDIKVSKARKIIRTYGYELDIRFSDKISIPVKDPSYIIRIPTELKGNSETAKKESGLDNIAFLYEFMKSHNITQRGLAKDIDISPGAVFTWFKTDDLAVSYLTKIKNTYDVNLEFTILKKVI